ncbi:MAG: nucleotidyltransferase domain-containing protein [Pseudomonadota bacterium]
MPNSEFSDLNASASMADALFSGTRQKLLGLLFGQPEREYSLSELIRLARAGSGAVQREIARLVDSGLISVQTQGRLKRYRANSESPIFEELCAISRKILRPGEQIAKALEPVQDQIEIALLYGSVAKGTDRADSDIDLLLVSDTLMLEEVFEHLQPAERELGRTIHPTLYTSAEYAQRKQQTSGFVPAVLAGRHEILFSASNEPR